MAIEIIPKKDENEIPASQALFSKISKILLVIVVVGTLAFLGLGKYLENVTQKTEKVIEEKKTEEFLKMDAKAREYQQKIEDYVVLIDVARTPLEMMRAVEEKMHPGVMLTQMKINVAQGEISAEGIADGLVAYDQQVRIFQDGEKFSKVDIPSFSITEEGKISFSITFSFRSETYKRVQ